MTMPMEPYVVARSTILLVYMAICLFLQIEVGQYFVNGDAVFPFAH
jgi:hypothetical protein